MKHSRLFGLVILVVSVLLFGYRMWASEIFNTRSNEDIQQLVCRLSTDQGLSRQSIESLRTYLLSSKHETDHLFSQMTMQVFIVFSLLVVLASLGYRKQRP
jgi:uncharacterized membrane protein affecting hemolysin expression